MSARGRGDIFSPALAGHKSGRLARGDTDYRAYGFFVEPVVFALLVYPRLLGSPFWVGLSSALVSGALAWPEIEAISVRALFLILAARLLSATLSFAVASLARRNP